MKNILILTKEYQHPQLSKCGGTGLFYKQFAEKLSAQGYNIFVFGTNKIPLQEETNNISLYFTKNYFSKYPLQELFRSICKKLNLYKLQEYIYKKEIKYITKKLKTYLTKKNISIDIIETHDWDGISLYLKELKIPYVVRTHGTWYILEKYFGYKTTKGKKTIEKEAILKSKNIITISNYCNKIYRDSFNIKGHIINNGINIQKFYPLKNREIIPYSIFHFGNTSNEKGFDITLKVFRELLNIYPSSTLHLIGRNNIKKIRDENTDIKDKIINHGFLGGEDLLKILNQGHVFLFPSKGETFGLSLCEVMAIKKVVITSNIPTFREIIIPNKNGFIAKNNEEYIKYISDIFSDKILQNFIERNARESIKTNYNLNITLDKTLNLYKKILQL